jgi:hypothetical protein
MYIKVGSACIGACLSKRMMGDGQGTQVALLWKLLRRLALRAPPAAPPPPPPPNVLPRTLEVSPPLAHLLHGCTDKFHGCIKINATCSVNAM